MDTLTIEAVSTLITNFGFPIVACIAIAYFVKSYIDKTDANNKEVLQQVREDNKELIEQIRQDGEKDRAMLVEEIRYNREVNQKLLSTNELLAKDLTNEVKDVANKVEKVANILSK